MPRMPFPRSGKPNPAMLTTAVTPPGRPCGFTPADHSIQYLCAVSIIPHSQMVKGQSCCITLMFHPRPRAPIRGCVGISASSEIRSPCDMITRVNALSSLQIRFERRIPVAPMVRIFSAVCEASTPLGAPRHASSAPED